MMELSGGGTSHRGTVEDGTDGRRGTNGELSRRSGSEPDRTPLAADVSWRILSRWTDSHVSDRWHRPGTLGYQVKTVRCSYS